MSEEKKINSRLYNTLYRNRGETTNKLLGQLELVSSLMDKLYPDMNYRNDEDVINVKRLLKRCIRDFEIHKVSPPSRLELLYYVTDLEIIHRFFERNPEDKLSEKNKINITGNLEYLIKTLLTLF